MRFSLIVPSVGRARDLARLLHSLTRQTWQEFEVIVVDQSGSAVLEDVIREFSGRLTLRHLRSTERGASRARNAGLPFAVGDIIAWPDDDCFYPPDLLETVQALFAAHPDWGALVGNPLDENGIAHSQRVPQQVRHLSLVTLAYVGVEYCLFVTRSVIERLGAFSEEIGPGAGTDWWAGEAADYEIRMLRSRVPLVYSPEVHVHHPNSNLSAPSPEVVRKIYHYAMGMGAAIRKNEVGKNPIPRWFIVYYALRYLRAALWSLLRGKVHLSRIHGLRLKGVLNGWRKFRILSSDTLIAGNVDNHAVAESRPAPPPTGVGRT